MRLAILLFLVIAFRAPSIGQPARVFIATLAEEPDSIERARLIATYLARNASPAVAGTTATFFYAGSGLEVSVPGEFNGWDPSRGMMTMVPGTRLFYREETLPADARCEYKIWVDSSWTLDPLNPRRAGGGYGDNSDLWMPEYVQSLAARFTPGIRRGVLDTLQVKSRKLGRTHPVFVYTPPGHPRPNALPVLFVTDGGDYLSLGRMQVILDNLLAAKKIAPLIAVFVDPRTDLADASTNRRMTDYAASEAYLDFLESEVAPLIEKRYGGGAQPEERTILGASMGGLIATYAVLTRPGFAANGAAQSPAYLQADSIVMRLTERESAKGRYFYIDAGTIRDTEREAAAVARQLAEKGAVVEFRTYHEGHNWTSWRARIPKILETFFPRK